MALDEHKLHEFLGRALVDLGGPVNAVLMSIGDELGLLLYYGASSLVCVPVSLARNGPALGAQAGERRLRDIMVDQGGFSTMRRATETPFNIVLEARP
jgi:hypothetical protein